MDTLKRSKNDLTNFDNINFNSYSQPETDSIIGPVGTTSAPAAQVSTTTTTIPSSHPTPVAIYLAHNTPQQHPCSQQENIEILSTSSFNKFINPQTLPNSFSENPIFDSVGIEKSFKIQQVVENAISDEARVKIHQILELVAVLTPTEKLLLYLRLPTDSVPAISDPLRQPLNPLGSRTEISQTINWIRTHLEEDPELSLPKHDVYVEYTAFCVENQMKALSTADFGKVMKQVYPRVRPRRLGTRGNSRYCYAGLRKRIKLEVPILPDLIDTPKSTEVPCSQADLMAAASCLIREWAEKLLGVSFSSLSGLASHLIKLGTVDIRSRAALTVNNAVASNSEARISENVGSVHTDTVSSSGKHREMQIQLQRKLHQREINREQKRKLQLQTPKCDNPKRSNKKIKVEQTSPLISPIIEEEQPLNPENEHKSSLLIVNQEGLSRSQLHRQTLDCDNKISSVTTTSTLPLLKQASEPIISSSSVPLPQFSNFQTNNADVVHDFSKKTQNNSEQRATKKAKPSTKKSESKSISVKSFANKPISRSNSYENNPNGDDMTPSSSASSSIDFNAQKPIKRATPSNDKERAKETLVSSQKVAIPRLSNKTKSPVSITSTISSTSSVPTSSAASILILSQNTSTAANLSQKVKYKAIQPKRVCDNSDVGGCVAMAASSQQPTLALTDNPNELTTNRSQDNSVRNNKYKNNINFNKDSCNNNENDSVESQTNLDKKSTSRERGISIGNIDKDALNDYLWEGNNSQEQEEELMQYFPKQNASSTLSSTVNQKVQISKREDSLDKTEEISQLRLLLQQNLSNQTANIGNTNASAKKVQALEQISVISSNSKSCANSFFLSRPPVSTQNVLGAAKRRVSFEAPESVPPSPNTRRKNFSFTPISPGPHSPSSTLSTNCGPHSKCSSTNASPFVSPRNTPVLRNRNNITSTTAGSNLSNPTSSNFRRNSKQLTLGKLTLDTSSEIKFLTPIETQNTLLFSGTKNLPMSAPPSPMLTSSYRLKSSNTARLQNYDLQSLLDGNDNHFMYSPNINAYIEKKLQIEPGGVKPSKLKIDIFSQSDSGKDETNSVDIGLVSSAKSTPSLPSSTPSLPLSLPDPLSQEVSQFFPDDTHITYNHTNNHKLSTIESNLNQYRSQSVPLRQQKCDEQNILHYQISPGGGDGTIESSSASSATNFYINPTETNFNFMTSSSIPSTSSSVGQTPVPNEFSDFNEHFTTDPNTAMLMNENFNHIINLFVNENNMADSSILGDTVVTEGSSSSDQNNALYASNSNPYLNFTNTNSENNMILMRSQSIDFSDHLPLSSQGAMPQPSRSVPSTPLPYFSKNLKDGILQNSEDYVVIDHLSLTKSHPSTPQIQEPNIEFNYKGLQNTITRNSNDYLLNGRRISTKQNALLTEAQSNDPESFLITSNIDRLEPFHVDDKMKENNLLLATDNFVDGDDFSFNDPFNPFGATRDDAMSIMDVGTSEGANGVEDSVAVEDDPMTVENLSTSNTTITRAVVLGVVDGNDEPRCSNNDIVGDANDFTNINFNRNGL